VGVSYEGPGETGYFCAPRSLPLVLRAMREKKVKAKAKVSGKADPGDAYLELLAMHLGHGMVILEPDEDHALAAGYGGTKAAKTWRERAEPLDERQPGARPPREARTDREAIGAGAFESRWGTTVRVVTRVAHRPCGIFSWGPDISATAAAPIRRLGGET